MVDQNLERVRSTVVRAGVNLLGVDTARGPVCDRVPGAERSSFLVSMILWTTPSCRRQGIWIMAQAFWEVGNARER